MAGKHKAPSTLDEQEDLSIQQQMAQQYNAFAKQREEEAKAAGRQRLEEQEDKSIQQQIAQQCEGFANQKEEVGAGEAIAESSTSKTLEDKIELAEEFWPDSGDQATRNEVSCILQGSLYLTNFRGVENAGNLEALNIKHIVCVNEQSNTHADKFNYFNIDTLEDQEDHDASEHFEKVQCFVDSALLTGGAVVFHCAAGISRSSTVLIAYLMAARRMSLFEAFQLVYSRRRVVWPNRAFVQQLIDYEHKLQKGGCLSGNTKSITIEKWDEWCSCSSFVKV
jgi:protein-tyrosine phosphatase